MYIHDELAGLEKDNDEAKRNFRSNNHIDDPKEIIVTDARLQQLSHCQRKKENIQKWMRTIGQ